MMMMLLVVGWDDVDGSIGVNIIAIGCIFCVVVVVLVDSVAAALASAVVVVGIL